MPAQPAGEAPAPEQPAVLQLAPATPSTSRTIGVVAAPGLAELLQKAGFQARLLTVTELDNGLLDPYGLILINLEPPLSVTAAAYLRDYLGRGGSLIACSWGAAVSPRRQAGFPLYRLQEPLRIRVTGWSASGNAYLRSTGASPLFRGLPEYVEVRARATPLLETAGGARPEAVWFGDDGAGSSSANARVPAIVAAERCVYFAPSILREALLSRQALRLLVNAIGLLLPTATSEPGRLGLAELEIALAEARRVAAAAGADPEAPALLTTAEQKATAAVELAAQPPPPPPAAPGTEPAPGGTPAGGTAVPGETAPAAEGAPGTGPAPAGALPAPGAQPTSTSPTDTAPAGAARPGAIPAAGTPAAGGTAPPGTAPAAGAGAPGTAGAPPAGGAGAPGTLPAGVAAPPSTAPAGPPAPGTNGSAVAAAPWPAAAAVADAIDASERVSVLEAPCRTTEVRAVLLPRRLLPPSRFAIGQMLDRLRDAGVNLVIPEVYSAGITLSPGPNQDPRFAGHDPLASLLAEAGPRGIAVHAWGALLSAGPASARAGLLATRPTWAAQTRAGGRYVRNGLQWLCPSQVTVRDALCEGIRRSLNGYAVQGLLLDDVDFGGSAEACFDPSCVGLFRGDTGRNPRTDALRGEWEQEWLRWRRDRLTTLVRRVTRDMRTLRPGVPIHLGLSAASLGPRTALADWRAWVAAGWVDGICPELTSGDTGEVQALAQRVQRLAPTARVLPLIPTAQVHTGSHALRLVQAAQGSGAAGVVFDSHVAVTDPWPAELSRGCFRKAARLPW